MIKNTVSKVIYTVGTSTVFSFDVPFYQASDIECWLEMSDETSKQLTQGTDYTVEVKTSYEYGAKITLVTGTEHIPTLPTGKKLSIMRVLPYTQETNLPDSGKLPSSRMEEQFDKIVCILQQLKEEIDRTLQVPPTREADKKTLFEEFSELAEHAEEWAETAESSSETAVAASATAVAARDSAIAAQNGANDSAASASASSDNVESYYEQSRLGGATINFGTWSAPESEGAADISFGSWTNDVPASKIDVHNSDEDAHSSIKNTVTTLDGRVTAAEGKITSLEGTVNTLSGAGYIRGQAYNAYWSSRSVRSDAIEITTDSNSKKSYVRDPSNDITEGTPLYAWKSGSTYKYTETADQQGSSGFFAFNSTNYQVYSKDADSSGSYIKLSSTGFKYYRYDAGDVGEKDSNGIVHDTETQPAFYCWKYSTNYRYTRKADCAVGDRVYGSTSYSIAYRVLRPYEGTWTRSTHGINFEELRSGSLASARAQVRLYCTAADSGYSIGDYSPWEGDACIMGTDVLTYTPSGGISIPKKGENTTVSVNFSNWTYEFRIWY